MVSHWWEEEKRAIFLFNPSFSGGEKAAIALVERDTLDLQSPSPRNTHQELAYALKLLKSAMTERPERRSDGS